IKLKVSAPCIIKFLNAFFICRCKVFEEYCFILIHFSIHYTSEVKHARARNRHFRRLLPGLLVKELEIFNELMFIHSEFARYFDCPCLLLLIFELDTVAGPITFNTCEILQKIEMPPCSAEFTVSHSFKSGFLLSFYDSFYFFILYLF